MDLSGLNERQKEAVEYLEGPLLVLAGAGSGKTRVLTYRIANLVESGVSPKNILAVTFTNKAAGEMKERIQKLLGKRLDLFCGTFHSFGARILRQENQAVKKIFSRKSTFVIFDDKDTLSLIKRILKEKNISLEQFPPAIVANHIGRAKSFLEEPEDLSKEAENFFQQKIASLYQEYEDRLREYNAFDFDDLIVKVVQLFRKETKILEKYQDKYRYILVDEYQDTNFSQYQLVKLLADKYKNICVVGDDQQAIYGFRFATFKNILNFGKDFPKAKIILLEENYRSTKNILGAANALISKNVYQKPKNLWTKKGAGSPIFLVEAKDEREEARIAVGKVQELIEGGVQPEEIAVFYRVNAQSRPVEEVLIQAGIPYRVVGSLKFYERKEIKDILAYLRLAVNPFDRVSLERILNTPPRGIGKKTLSLVLPSFDKLFKNEEERKGLPEGARALFKLLEELRKKAKESGVVEMIDFIIKKVGYEQYLQKQANGEARLENLAELISAAMPFDKVEAPNGLLQFLESVALLQEADEAGKKNKDLSLMTLHSAKGLEFNYVFILGVEEGILPHWKARKNLEDLEEERRLLYVGITRAKKEVYLFYAQKRLIFGDIVFSRPSEFLKDLPKDLVLFISTSFFQRG